VKDGWAIEVKNWNATLGKTVTVHYIVAIEDRAEAVRVVKALVGPECAVSPAAPVEVRLLVLKNMAEGEVRRLGMHRSRRLS
jgi:hypothetical protein